MMKTLTITMMMMTGLTTDNSLLHALISTFAKWVKNKSLVVAQVSMRDLIHKFTHKKILFNYASVCVKFP